jgi:hypothetical protein
MVHLMARLFIALQVARKAILLQPRLRAQKLAFICWADTWSLRLLQFLSSHTMPPSCTTPHLIIFTINQEPILLEKPRLWLPASDVPRHASVHPSALSFNAMLELESFSTSCSRRPSFSNDVVNMSPGSQGSRSSECLKFESIRKLACREVDRVTGTGGERAGYSH